MNRALKLAFLFSLALGFMVAGPVGGNSAQRSSSKTVLFHVAVTTDGGGGFASGVSRESFLVASDNQQQQITFFQEGPIPSSICIVLDTTKRLSLFHQTKGNIVLQSVTKGLAEFQNLAPNTEYSIVGIGEHAQLLLDWTHDLKTVEGIVGSVELKGRQSALYDASFMALEKLEQAKHQKRLLLIISGSSDNKSQRKFSDLRKSVRENGYLVYSVGILDFKGPPAEIARDSQWESEMRELSTVSGGLLRIAGDPDSVLFQFSKLSLELQRQYVIGFVSANVSQKAQYLKVQIKLNGTQPGLKGLRVRSQEGYLAGGN